MWTLGGSTPLIICALKSSQLVRPFDLCCSLHLPAIRAKLGLATTYKMAAENFVIKVPCSSANIGPGFDVIGLALSMYLELRVTIDRSKTTSTEPLNCKITYEGEGADEISLDPDHNLLTRVALYVLRCHDQRAFPVETHVHVVNPIPLGRGLGSSGAAVVAGVLLGKECGGLDLSKDRLFDFCLMIGRFELHHFSLVSRKIKADMRFCRAPPRQRRGCTVRWLRGNLSQASPS